MKFPKNDIIDLLDDRLAYNLGESTNKDLILGEIWDADLENGLKQLKLEYGTSQGNPKLRALLAKKLGVLDDEVLITTGAIGGILLSILTACEPGDEIITVQPNFPPTIDLIGGLGFVRKMVTLEFEHQYELQLESVLEQLTTRTKLIILVSPLNPSGTLIDASKVQELLKILDRDYPNCRMLMDETYREAIYGQAPPVASFATTSSRLMTTASLSKCHGTPGLRIGWLTTKDSALMEDLKVAKLNTIISNSVLDEFLAIKVLEKETLLFEPRQKHAAKGLEITRNWVEKHTNWVDWVEPKAGALCCIKLKEEALSDEQVHSFFQQVKNSEVQLARGEWFHAGSRIFRLGFGYMDLEGLNIALAKMSEVLHQNRT